MAAVFHLAYPVKDKEQTRRFYRDVLGCAQGREAETWVDFDFFGHQVSFHVKPEAFNVQEPTNAVDGKDVPVRHFGAVLEWGNWHALRDRLIVARKAGFGIKAIKQMLEQNKTAGLPMKNTVVVAAQTRVHAIEQEIEVLQKQRQLLTDAKMCSCIDLSKCSMFG